MKYALYLTDLWFNLNKSDKYPTEFNIDLIVEIY